jgi:hypothetical protein
MHVHDEFAYTQNVSFKDFENTMPKVQGKYKRCELSLCKMQQMVLF